MDPKQVFNDLLIKRYDCDAKSITDESSLADLGLNSLDLVEVIIDTEETFGTERIDDSQFELTTPLSTWYKFIGANIVPQAAPQ